MTIIDGYCTLGVDREYEATETSLLNAMDQAGVDVAVIATIPRHMAVGNRVGNDRVLQAATAHPDRFIPTCTASPWHGEAAVEEVRRAVEQGARMLVLEPTVQGFGLGDDLASPLIEQAARLGMPVYVHTGGYQYGTPGQLALTAQRFPRAAFIMGHAGTTDFKQDAIEVARSLPNVFIETSLTRPFGAQSALEALGDERVIMGSAAPLNDLQFEWQETRTLLPPEDYPAFYGRTMGSLLTGEAS